MNMLRVLLLTLLAIPLPVTAQVESKQRTLITDLQNPVSLYATRDFVFVVEQGRNRILQLDHTGTLIHTFGNRGSGDFQFDRPFDIDATNGLKIYISDRRNERIQVFDRRWQLLSSVEGYSQGIRQQSVRPSWIGVNRLGELLFYDERSGMMIKMDENGTLIDEIPLPVSVKEISGFKVIGNDVFILDRREKVIHLLSDAGIYRSFYPAESVMAFDFYNGTLWTALSDTIQRGDALFPIDVSGEIRDIEVSERNLFILTEDKLLTLSYD